MQSAKIPRTICDDIDRKTRRFIWGGNDEQRKIHLLSWETLQHSRDNGGIGIRSARQANSAFLTKLGWRALTEPNALWSRVLRQKYCKGRCDVDMFCANTNMSNVWRGIVENAKIIQQGTATMVGNGNRTLFWDHSWVTDAPLNQLVTQTIPTNVEGATVHEMWKISVVWKWEKFVDLLPNDVLKRIASHDLVEDPEAGDLLYWKGNTHGKFLIKYALKIIRNEEHENADFKWDIIWRAPVQKRIRAFMWLLAHEKLLCNVNCVRRHLSEDPSCKRCGAPKESLIHLFRECPTSRAIWHEVGGSALYNFFYTGSLKVWLTKNLEANGLIYSEKCPTCFATTLWWIWIWRNCQIFGRSDDIPLNVGIFIHSKVNETWLALMDPMDHISNTNLPNRKYEVFVKRQTPPVGWITLNSDGASKGIPGLPGGGGIFRDHKGKMIKGFSANFGICSAYKAELKAAAIGLSIAQEMGISKLFMQMDNLACIQALTSEEYAGGECYHIIQKCRKLIKQTNWEIEIAHCFREGNFAADWLANKGVLQEDNLLMFDVAPEGLGRLLLNDIAGVALPRFIS